MTYTGKLVYEEDASDWDRHFEEEWQRCGGSLQSLTFALKAIQHLWPHGIDAYEDWSHDQETNIISAKEVRIHDYGCAFGDGTALLQAAFPQARVKGFDFSEYAVETARRRWPMIEFEVGDVTEPDEDADLIFASHTLEHVKDPAETLRRLLSRCVHLIVIVPKITAEQTGGHEGAEPTEEWLKRCPEPNLELRYATLRRRALPEQFIVEGNIVLVFENKERIREWSRT